MLDSAELVAELGMNVWIFIALCAVLWPSFHLLAGYVAQRLPLAWLTRWPMISASYGWEHGGRCYEWLRIRAWKDHLPEAGGLLRDGFAKRQLASAELDYLDRFARETSRAEFGHWLTWALALTFFLWTPWWMGVFMLIYAGVINLPFILIQRYNRARLRRLMQRRRRANTRTD